MNTKTAAIISLVGIFILLIGIFVAHSDLFEKRQILDITWDETDPGANDGYLVYVTVYYDRTDRSLSFERVYDVGKATKTSTEVPQTSDMVDTAVVNVCFQVAGYNSSGE